MVQEFRQPVVWVTGAGRGIGREIAIQFSLIGCKVVLSSRTVRELNSVQKEITKLGGEAFVYRCDIGKASAISKTHHLIEKKLGGVDVLINNAGITSFHSFERTSLKEFDSIVGINLRGSFLCIKEVIPNMIKRKEGWIINIASVVATKIFKNSSAYSAAKAGLVAMLRVLREEVRQHNVKIITIFPGATSTKIWEGKLHKLSNKMMDAKSIAETVLSLYRLKLKDAFVEELIIRPTLGDLE
ncbi:MAG: SDR family oxidoreductase [Bacteroidota bacterium]|nr:SDR family oxidoreductase [Bacteroidota bacterium]